MLGIVDFVVMGVFLAVCLGIGLYSSLSGDKQESTDEYFFGGRKLKIFPVTVSMFFSFISAIIVLGSTAEIYDHGIVFWGFMLGEWMMIPVAAFVMIPVFIDTGAPTVTQYLGRRFNSSILRKVMSVTYMIRMLAYMSVCFLAPSIAFRAGTGYPTWVLILISSAVATIYTAIGGIKAVVWTDTVQGIVLICGLITILVKAVIDAGGYVEMFQAGIKENRVYVPSPNPDPTFRRSMWAYTFGVMFSVMPQMGFSQETVQRVMSLPSKKAARTSILLMYPISLTVHFICVSVAVAVFAYYSTVEKCDLVESGVLQSSNEVLPHYVFTRLKALPGFGGLFLASLCSGALSSVSSGLNGIAVMVWEDFVGPRWKDHMTTKQAVTFSKIVVVVLGAVGAGFAVALSYLPGTIVEITDSALGSFSGPLAGVYFLAFFFPFSNSKGAIVGAMTGLVFDLWLVSGRLINQFQWTKLPPFTTSGCDAENVTSMWNATTSLGVNTSSVGYSTAGSHPLYSVHPSTTVEPSHQPEGWEQIHMVHFYLYPVVGALVTTVVGIIVSLLTGRTKTSDVNLLHLSPVVRWLFEDKNKSHENGNNGNQVTRQRNEDHSDEVENSPEKVRLTDLNPGVELA